MKNIKIKNLFFSIIPLVGISFFILANINININIKKGIKLLFVLLDSVIIVVFIMLVITFVRTPYCLSKI